MSSSEEHPDRVLLCGKPDLERCDNRVRTSKFTLLSFLPLAVLEQFRRFANTYFLLMGCIMAIGTYTDLFESAISPWTTLGPLSVVISFSLLVEGVTDYKRHVNDEETNNAPCVVLRRAEQVTAEGGQRDRQILHGKAVTVVLRNPNAETTASPHLDHVVNICFETVPRKDIRQGHLVLVKNREMVPADIILLASSNDQGSAYIETSSIDGETNLKLRVSPQFPKHVLEAMHKSPLDLTFLEHDEPTIPIVETLEQATKRITRISALSNPSAQGAIYHPNYTDFDNAQPPQQPQRRRSSFMDIMHDISTTFAQATHMNHPVQPPPPGYDYAATLTAEAPNPHINTFLGKLTLPPQLDMHGTTCHDIPLGVENILLRGAVLRNTEWVLGLACFTGRDTKLVQNSVQTPSKFSQLDQLMNRTVVSIICVMLLCVIYLSSQAVVTADQQFHNLWYVGYNNDTAAVWPTLPDLPPPEWDSDTYNWIQRFFLYVTLLNNFVPLSLYVTVEFINFMMLWFVYVDLTMYDETTNTRAVARSTIVTDLGLVQYIFSDKTGTLTQNIMKFKQCSVDGMVFGSPATNKTPTTPFHPLGHVRLGRVPMNAQENNSGPLLASGTFHEFDGLEYDLSAGVESPTATTSPRYRLSFNTELFLRIMSLCHTVVVEKDLDSMDTIDASKSASSQTSSWSGYARRLFGVRRNSGLGPLPLNVVCEDEEEEPSHHDCTTPLATPRSLNLSYGGDADHRTRNSSMDYRSEMGERAKDGAPLGYAYQAESPDEGALVEAASLKFGFQVISRDSSGIRLRCSCPSLFQNVRISQGLKDGSLTPKSLQAQDQAIVDEEPCDCTIPDRIETWAILAVNKFDSERKRMSILVRSPPELGSVPMLLCKGADSAMLDPEVLMDGQTTKDDAASHDDEELELDNMLNLEAHLGDFASEGLRTLVLGMRIVSEEECEEWLELHKAATTAIKNRDELLKEAALAIERELHIVGATAIEDKLQKGVPETIATLEKAGIKLWVLTGDKRETAIEIGYSTQVLTPKMHLSEFVDRGSEHAQAQMSMEFMRLVKMGRLPQYQRKLLDQADSIWTKENIKFKLGKLRRAIWRSVKFLFLLLRWLLVKCFRKDTKKVQAALQNLKKEAAFEAHILRRTQQRRNVRDRAERIIREYTSKHGKKPHADNSHDGEEGFGFEDLSLASGELPMVFNRAQSARDAIELRKSQGKMSQTELRSLALARFTSQQAEQDNFLVDEDVLSLKSFFPDSKNDANSYFDKKKRTILEKMFAVDHDVRKGRLRKHLKKEKLATISEAHAADAAEQSDRSLGELSPHDGPRALVVEGAALKHLLGDPELEQLVFAVASSCDAVIACRVSPKQKALLVNLVRHHVEPVPVTLAIGDGANDVGMIQEAHVGVGISGKEGKQAVNASDFAIAQFRFLEDLVLIHGRWNFFRMSTVVFFSFYKNAVMAVCLIIYSTQTVFSGTPLFDQWVIPMLNFVSGVPILVLGLFDRCLGKEYVKRNPEVFAATRRNELLTMRSLIRWGILTFTHAFTLYFLTVPQQALNGGSITAVFDGLARNESRDSPGDGEGGDLLSVGTVTFTCMIIMLAYKVLYESKSLIHGRWPAFTCRQGVGEGFFSRLAYTWVGVAYTSIGFHLIFISIYQILGRKGAGPFAPFVDVANHVLSTRSLTWMLLTFVPIAGIAFDVSGKLFSNMFYPTQTQIHIEIEAKEKAEKKKRKKAHWDCNHAEDTMNGIKTDELGDNVLSQTSPDRLSI